MFFVHIFVLLKKIKNNIYIISNNIYCQATIANKNYKRIGKTNSMSLTLDIFFC